jgi:hypothetical protein
MDMKTQRGRYGHKGGYKNDSGESLRDERGEKPEDDVCPHGSVFPMAWGCRSALGK